MLMTRQLYSERFPKYAEAFEWAWERYQKGEKPTWHHWWLQRYLQISPSYYEFSLLNLKHCVLSRILQPVACVLECGRAAGHDVETGPIPAALPAPAPPPTHLPASR